MSENEDKTGQQQTESQGGFSSARQPTQRQPHENNVNIPKNEERRSNQTPGAGSGGEGG